MTAIDINAEASLLFEEINDEDISENIKSLPTEDDLPYDDGEPMETATPQRSDESADRFSESILGKSEAILYRRKYVSPF